MPARKRRGEGSAEVEAVRQRIEHWRKTRPRRTAMPQELWTAAAEVARIHGLWAVSRALRVNYESLKKRLGPRPVRRASARKMGFVEVTPVPAVGSAARAGTVVEIVAVDGTRLTVRLEDRSGVDLASLLDAFCRRS